MEQPSTELVREFIDRAQAAQRAVDFVLFVQRLEHEHAQGAHVIPSYASCPSCAKARAAARRAAGIE